MKRKYLWRYLKLRRELFGLSDDILTEYKVSISVAAVFRLVVVWLITYSLFRHMPSLVVFATIYTLIEGLTSFLKVERLKLLQGRYKPEA
jgi:hypothetical protein